MTRHNPFSTRFIRPGQIPFVFPPGQSAETLAQKLSAPAAQGAIVGPHGSGKSTLLETLAPQWPRLGLSEQRVRATATVRPRIEPRSLTPQSILVVDGFEQLPWWRQRQLRWLCMRRKTRLLVTCHRPCGLEVLLQTEPTWELARQLTAKLFPGHISPYEEQLRQLWDQQPGDIREYFFRLYHFCESQGLYRPRCLPTAPHLLPER